MRLILEKILKELLDDLKKRFKLTANREAVSKFLANLSYLGKACMKQPNSLQRRLD